jgi:HlyD family secretion protein
MKSRSWLFMACALCAGMCWGAAGLAQTGSPATATTQARPGGVVLLATIDAYWSADQYAKLSGYVSEVHADIGDQVKKGQVLAVIDDPELQKQLAGAQATLAARKQQVMASEATVQQAQAAVEVAKKQLAGLEAEARLAQVTLKRQEELYAGKAATGQQIDEIRAKAEVAGAAAEVGNARIGAAEADLRAAEANRAVAAAQVEVALADVKHLETLVDYTKIVSPFDAVVTRRWVNPGELVQAATANRTSPLFTCQQLSVVRVMCDVPEVNAAAVHVSDDAQVEVGGSAGRVIRGKVTRTAWSLIPQSRTMRAEIDLDNADGKLLPGTYAQVKLWPGSGATAASASTRP